MAKSSSYSALFELLHKVSFLTEEKRSSFLAKVENMPEKRLKELCQYLQHALSVYEKKKEKTETDLLHTIGNAIQEIDTNLKRHIKLLENNVREDESKESEGFLRTISQ